MRGGMLLARITALFHARRALHKCAVAFCAGALLRPLRGVLALKAAPGATPSCPFPRAIALVFDTKSNGFDFGIHWIWWVVAVGCARG